MGEPNREGNRGFITILVLARSQAKTPAKASLSVMAFADAVKTVINRKSLQPLALPLVNGLLRAQRRSVERIFLDDGLWIHQTSRGYFAYHQPYLRLDLRRFDESARRNFLWGYEPGPGDIIMDIGAGVGEETLTFSRAVGDRGQVICIEAHPRTFRCLQAMVRYNGLKNVIPIHAAIAEPGRATVSIENGNEYLANRIGRAGVRVPAMTIDEICSRLNLDRIHFLKMNIEGAERLAIQGMSGALGRINVLCISCHDFLAKSNSDSIKSRTENTESAYRTKDLVREFLQRSGLEIVERPDPALPPYIRDQLWGYNRRPA